MKKELLYINLFTCGDGECEHKAEAGEDTERGGGDPPTQGRADDELTEHIGEQLEHPGYGQVDVDTAGQRPHVQGQSVVG